ncbi:MAG: hypothetical protein EZS28_014263 [Streblomastix strix]|uniref:Uncharacterized protein n=1 Tax=Streblomastix strix TaxID=222440 RepID=A0A5J4W618_9EUKA|nr:MAG: hypothetical protein EZS28_014263 [Streblomastix strix]
MQTKLRLANEIITHTDHGLYCTKNGRNTKIWDLIREFHIRRNCSSDSDHEENMRISGEDFNGCIRLNCVLNCLDIELIGQERNESGVKE